MKRIPQATDEPIVAHDGKNVSTLERPAEQEEKLDRALAYLDKPAAVELPLKDWQPGRLKITPRDPKPEDRFKIVNRRAVEDLLKRIGEPNRQTVTRLELQAAGLRIFWLVRSGSLIPEDPETGERCGITPAEFSQAFEGLYKNDPASKLQAAFKLLDSMDGHPVLALAHEPAESFRRAIEGQLEATPAALEVVLNAIEKNNFRSAQAAKNLLTEAPENFAGKKALPLTSKLLSFAEARKLPEAVRESCLAIIRESCEKSPELFTRLLKLSTRAETEDIRTEASKALYAVCF